MFVFLFGPCRIKHLLLGSCLLIKRGKTNLAEDYVQSMNVYLICSVKPMRFVIAHFRSYCSPVKNLWKIQYIHNIPTKQSQSGVWECLCRLHFNVLMEWMRAVYVRMGMPEKHYSTLCLIHDRWALLIFIRLAVWGKNKINKIKLLQPTSSIVFDTNKNTPSASSSIYPVEWCLPSQMPIKIKKIKQYTASPPVSV